MTRAIGVLAGLSALGLVVAAPAVAGGLNVKTGLWETTMQGQVSGMPPIPAEDVARMPPQVRARMEAAMQAGMARASKPHVMQYCVSQAEIDKGFGPHQERANQSCTTKVSASSPTGQTVSMVCTGENKEAVNGTFRISADSPESISGTFDMTMTGGGNTMKLHHTMHSRWLGPDCGGLKPGHTKMG